MLEKATPSRSAENVTRKANKKAGKDGVQLPVNIGLQKRVEAEVGPISDLKDHQAFKVAIDKIRGNPQLQDDLALSATTPTTTTPTPTTPTPTTLTTTPAVLAAPPPPPATEATSTSLLTTSGAASSFFTGRTGEKKRKRFEFIDVDEDGKCSLAPLPDIEGDDEEADVLRRERESQMMTRALLVGKIEKIIVALGRSAEEEAEALCELAQECRRKRRITATS